jgi:hypothetical protein
MVVLWGVAQHVATVRDWFGGPPGSDPTGAGFLFVLLSSLAGGLFISGLRQQVLEDFLFRRLFKLERPSVDESRLTQPDVLGALRFAADNLYRYYQFYSNMAFAIIFAYAAWLINDWGWSAPRALGLVGIGASTIVLVLSARYSLKRYFGTLESILR